MVVETLWPENAPWWLNLFIWMATFWWYILIGFVPAFYIAVAKLFGMPLLQRWSQEVVIMLYPNKVKFAKLKEQFDPYIAHGKGIYWLDNPMKPEIHQEIPPKIEEKLTKLKEKYESLASPENKIKNKDELMKKILKQQTKLQAKITTVDPRNMLHIYTHAINQSITNTERRESKVDEILHNNPTPKKIPGHGVWLLQNPKLHFHRHWAIYISPDSSTYKLVPVKNRQQFGIGFWHSLGVIKTAYEQITEPIVDEDGNNTGSTRQRQILVETNITTNLIMQNVNVIQDYQNFSASRAYMILKKRARIENNWGGFNSWILGTFDARILLLIAGMVGAVAVIFLFLHGGGSPTTGATGPKMIL